MPQESTITGTPVRISFSVEDAAEGTRILEELTEQRLIAGGTMVEAQSVNWIGGSVKSETRKIVTAYTLMEKLPVITAALNLYFQGEAPVLSQFVMTNEKKTTLGWIERNVR